MYRGKLVLYIALLQSVVAFLGSIFYSNVANFTPCILCWYQRVCMYPLVIILAVGILLKDKKVFWYAMPLAVIGWLIAFYHNLLQYKVIPEAISPCSTTGVSCTTLYANYFGFITIPLLSLLAFTLIIICLYLYMKFTQVPSDKSVKATAKKKS